MESNIQIESEKNSDIVGDREKRFQASKKVTIIGAVANVILSTGKILAGVFGNSPVMIADGVHSASDLVSDAVVVWGMQLGKASADEDHPYGHGRFETLATLFLAFALFAVAIGIIVDAVDRLGSPELITPPELIALWAAVLSIIIKEGLYHYTVIVGRKYNAKAIIANAWHHRSDAISSVAALAGIGGAMLGLPLLDPVAAVAVAVIVGKMGLEFARDALKEFSDSAIDESIQKSIKEMVATIPEVQDAHFLKGRQMGSDILIDVHIEVHPFISVSEGHQIAEKVRYTLLKQIKEVNDVMVHVDTVDDHAILVPVLHSRREMLEKIEQTKKSFLKIVALENLSLHYIPEGIIINLSISLDSAATFAEGINVAEQFQKSLQQIEGVQSAVVHLFASDGGHWTEQDRYKEWVQAS
jgi:cation diffusion facilitator family transporter